jgi:hypothetical protein
MSDLSRYRASWKKGYGYVYDPDGPWVEWRHVEDLQQQHNDLRKRFNELREYIANFCKLQRDKKEVNEP